MLCRRPHRSARCDNHWCEAWHIAVLTILTNITSLHALSHVSSACQIILYLITQSKHFSVAFFYFLTSGWNVIFETKKWFVINEFCSKRPRNKQKCVLYREARLYNHWLTNPSRHFNKPIASQTEWYVYWRVRKTFPAPKVAEWIV